MEIKNTLEISEEGLLHLKGDTFTKYCKKKWVAVDDLIKFIKKENIEDWKKLINLHNILTKNDCPLR